MTASVLRGDARHLPLPDASVDLVVTSPPYFGLRSYTDGGEHYDGQIGSEATPQEWVAALVACTREWVRVLKPSGSIFVNLGDKYDSGTTTARINPGTVKDGQGQGWHQGTPRVSLGTPKSLLGLPWRYALACTDQLGLILRAEIIWAKPNGLPESVTDRVRRAHEQVFHFTVRPRYYSAVDEIREPQATNAERHIGRSGYVGAPDGIARSFTERSLNPLGKLPGSVWDIPSQPLTVPPALGIDHFAAFPMELPRRIIAGWSPPGVCTGCGEGRRPEAPRENYGHALTAARQRAGLSRQAVADALRCHVRSLSDWEDEGHLPRGETWDALDRLLSLGLSREQFIAAYDYEDQGSPVDTDRRRLAIANGAAPWVIQRKNVTARRGAAYACACPQPTAPTRPSVVLDPFGGTGTTALVADALGRHGITVDMSADYCRLAAWRTTDPAERARALEVPKPPAVINGQESLFEVTA